MQATRAFFLKPDLDWLNGVRFKTLFVLACLMLDCDASAANLTKAPTHCNPHEKVVFSCPFKNGKTVSLCGSADLSKDTGTLQYRFGRVGRGLELSYPKPAEHPRENFLYFPGEPFGKPEKGWFYGPSRILSFKINHNFYSLEVFKNRGTFEFYGAVSVKNKANQIVADYACSLDKAIDHIEDLGNLGIPNSGEELVHTKP